MRQDKNKQEASIYIFTIVTIIFLPMSTVASILGMNTRDVRSMHQQQWVFWVVAVPLTVMVIIGSLYAAGSLHFAFRKDPKKAASIFRNADRPLSRSSSSTSLDSDLGSYRDRSRRPGKI